jgi:hypothetical protein
LANSSPEFIYWRLEGSFTTGSHADSYSFLFCSSYYFAFWQQGIRVKLESDELRRTNWSSIKRTSSPRRILFLSTISASLGSR